MRSLALTLVSAALAATLIVGCSNSSSTGTETPATSVNLTQKWGLEGTVRIEVYQRTDNGNFLRTVIDSPDTVGRVVSGLDKDIKLVDRVRCPADYDVHFVHDAGTRDVYGIVCGTDPDRIRGAQPFWDTLDAELPSAVGKAILDAVDQAPVLDDLASDRVVQEVVAQLVTDNPQLIPYAEYDWRRVNMAPRTLGASRFLYASTEWTVQVNWPIVADPEYSLQVAVPAAGFAWSGTYR